MSAQTSLVERTAMQIYLAEQEGRSGFTPFELLHPTVAAKYERMAKAALTEAYLEPVPAA